MPYEDRTILLEGATILWPNFTGKETMYNSPGDRNFNVILPEELAAQLHEEGWNIKRTNPREEGDVGQPFTQINLNYKKGRPPRVVMITSRGRTTLYEEDVEMLDWVVLREGGADMIINPSDWKVGDKSGTKGYLRSLFVHIEEDALERKYADLPDADSPQQGE